MKFRTHIYKLNIGYDYFLKVFQEDIGLFDVINMALVFYEEEGLFFYCANSKVLRKLKENNIVLIPYFGKIPTSKSFVKGAGNIELLTTKKYHPPQKKLFLLQNFSNLISILRKNLSS